MLAPGQCYSESFPAAAESVPHARAALSAVAEEAGANEERLQAIRLAASEAITNAVRHAYQEDGSGEVQVSASYVERELWVLIADGGSGLRARSKRPGLGLGLALIAQLADDFQIHSRATGGTEVQMRFRLHSPKPGSPHPRPVGPVVQLRGSFSAAVLPASSSF